LLVFGRTARTANVQTLTNGKKLASSGSDTFGDCVLARFALTSRHNRLL
jgi:hypothetical protein